MPLLQQPLEIALKFINISVRCTDFDLFFEDPICSCNFRIGDWDPVTKILNYFPIFSFCFADFEFSVRQKQKSVLGAEIFLFSK
jgi:hypothetical protein